MTDALNEAPVVSAVPPVDTLYHLKVPPDPVAFNVIVLGPQEVVGPETEGAAGSGFTVTVTGDDVAEHPKASVAVTV